jgi:hypothetical protein
MRKQSGHADLLEKLKAFEEANPLRRGPLCTVCALPEKYRSFIADSRKGTTLRALAAVINSEGQKVTHYCIGRHLRDGHGV